MNVDSDVLELVSSLRLGSLEDRKRIRDAVAEFLDRQGYQAQIGSFQNGTLILLAAPAEHALLRYDLAALRSHLDCRGLGEVVRDIRTRTRVLGQAA